MTAVDVLAAGLLALGVGVVLLCCLGLLVLHDSYDRLHCLGPASLLGPVFLAAAILLTEGWQAAGIKAIATSLVLILIGPVLTHATAQAIYHKRANAPLPAPEEITPP